jgi:hypothetical protein
MRFISALAIVALLGACTDGGTTKLDGRVKHDTGKKDVTKTDLPPTADLAADTTPTVDLSKVDQKKVDKSKVDQSKVDQSKVDQSKVDQSKVDQKKPDKSLTDQKAVDVSKVDVGPIVGKLVINEIDYDQPSPPDDAAEFVEIYNGTSAAVSLTDLAVVFFNGNTEYKRVTLASATSLPAGGYLVIASSTVTVDAGAKKILFTGATDQIQNGPTDGVALINTSTKQVIDSLCYEGAVTAAVITGFSAPVSLVEGTVLATSVADSNTVAGSLVRLPNGIDTNNANSDWKFSSTPTPGKANQ